MELINGIRYSSVGLVGAGLVFVLSGSSISSPKNSYENFERYTLIKSGNFDLKATIGMERSGSTIISKSLEIIEKLPSNLENIKNTFSLSNDELAKIIGVSRKTLHNWKTGNIRSSEKRKRIFDLFLLATNWSNAGFSRNRHDLEKKILNGKSILDLLVEEDLNAEKMLFAGSRIDLLSPRSEKGLF